MNINYKGEITIEQAMSEMRANPDRVFWLAFVRSSGREKGTVKVVARCRYGAPQSAVGSRQTAVGGSQSELRNKPLHVEHGTLPMTDYDSGQYITPLISHCIGYNLRKIIH